MALRSKRLFLLLLTALAVCLMAPGSGPRIETARGSVEIGSGEPPVWRAARNGDALAPGDAVRTGADGRAELVLDGATVRLYSSSLLRLPATLGSGGTRAVRMERGRSLFDVLRRSDRPRFEVRTPEVVVSVKGTRFSVDLEDVLVAVYHGTVGVREIDDALIREVLVREGFAAGRGPGQPFELFVHGAADPWDGWMRDGSLPASAFETGAFTPPAKRAALEARAEARNAYRRKSLVLAMERDEVLADRIEKLARAQQRRSVDKERALERTVKLERDFAVDTPGRRVERKLGENFTENFLNDPAGGGLPGGPDFEINFLEGSGAAAPEQVELLTSAGDVWSFDEGEVELVLDGGNAFPAALQLLLTGAGVDDRDLAKLMLKMFEAK